ncbi:MAG TPA: VTT domain-containing protein [Candidatus Paceibacterota bacterium]|nr:VTT domain-containing protein [Candidatus Paceibacterota bacterium]
METLLKLAEFALHIDKYLVQIVANYGSETYLILFLTIFLETGMVFTPFLPGDSLLFASGMITANSDLNIFFLLIILSVAAILGDSVNYSIGKYFSYRIKNGQNIPFVKQEYVEKTERFYEKYGNKTIFIARFVPVIRTMAPFFAGFGSLNYSSFIFYNIAGGLSWVALFLFGGYYFGNVQIVKDNFSAAIMFVIIVSIIPAIVECIRESRLGKK